MKSMDGTFEIGVCPFRSQKEQLETEELKDIEQLLKKEPRNLQKQHGKCLF